MRLPHFINTIRGSIVAQVPIPPIMLTVAVEDLTELSNCVKSQHSEKCCNSSRLKPTTTTTESRVPIFWDDGGGGGGNGALQEADRQSGLAFGEKGSMAPSPQLVPLPL